MPSMLIGKLRESRHRERSMGPLDSFRTLQSFSFDRVPVGVCSPRTTTAAGTCLLDKNGGRPLAERSGRSAGKVPPAPIVKACVTPALARRWSRTLAASGQVLHKP